MKHLLLFLFTIISFSVFAQKTDAQLKTSINNEVRNKTASQYRLAAELDTLVDNKVNKQTTINGQALTGNITISGGISGTLAAVRIPFAKAATQLRSSANLTYDSVNARIVMNTNDYIELSTRFQNRFIGRSVGNTTITGEGNLSIGNNSMTLATTAAYNVNLGYFAGQNITSGQSNTFINHGAGAQTTIGFYNLGIGFHANYVNPAGSFNIALGPYALDQNTTGDGNIWIGGMASANTGGFTGGNRNLTLGFNIAPINSTGSDQLNIQNAFYGVNNVGNIKTLSTGNLGAYVQTPTARFHIIGGTATAGTASLKINSGTLLGTTEAGALENDGTDLHFTLADGGTRYRLTRNWGLTGTSTLQGVATVTSNAENQHIFNGTWTATANNSFHANFTGALTGTATNNHVLLGYRVTPSITLNNAASTQTAIGLDVLPTFTGGTGPIYISQRITGPTTNSTGIPLLIRDAGGTSVFSMTDAGNMTGKSGTSWSIGNGTFTLSTLTAGSSSDPFITNAPTTPAAVAYSIRRTGANQYTTPIIFIDTKAGLTMNAGTGTYVQLSNTAIFNTTGTFSGTAIGFDHNPTMTSSTGLVNIASRNTSGFVQWNSLLTPSQITSNQDDYNPTGWNNGGAPHGASILRLTSDASRNITSLTGGINGRLTLIVNAGAQNIVLKDDDGSTGTAANRFQLNADITLLPEESAMLWYDGTSSRWRVIK